MSEYKKSKSYEKLDNLTTSTGVCIKHNKKSVFFFKVNNL